MRNLENINLVGVEKIGFLPPILSYYYSRVNMTYICFLFFISVYVCMCVHTHIHTQYEMETSFWVEPSYIIKP